MYYGHRPLSAAPLFPTRLSGGRAWWLHAAPLASSGVATFEVWAFTDHQVSAREAHAPVLSFTEAHLLPLRRVGLAGFLAGLCVVAAAALAAACSWLARVAERPRGFPASRALPASSTSSFAPAATQHPSVLSAPRLVRSLAGLAPETAPAPAPLASPLCFGPVSALVPSYPVVVVEQLAACLPSHPALAPYLLSRSAAQALLRHGLLNLHLSAAAALADSGAGRRLTPPAHSPEWALSRVLVARECSPKLRLLGESLAPAPAPTTLRASARRLPLSQPSPLGGSAALSRLSARWVRRGRPASRA